MVLVAGMRKREMRDSADVLGSSQRRGGGVCGVGVDGWVLQLRGGAVSAGYSGELRGDRSLLHKNMRGDGLEVRRNSGNGVESSEGWEVDGVDQKRGKSAAEMGVSGERLGRPGGEMGVVVVGKQKRVGRGSKRRAREGR